MYTFSIFSFSSALVKSNLDMDNAYPSTSLLENENMIAGTKSLSLINLSNLKRSDPSVGFFFLVLSKSASPSKWEIHF